MGVVEYMRGVSEHGRRGGNHGTTELTMRQTPLAGMIRLVRLKLALMLRIGPLHIQQTRDEQECENAQGPGLWWKWLHGWSFTLYFL